MKVTATVETETNLFRVEFQIDDPDIARRKLTELTAEIQRRFCGSGEKVTSKRGQTSGDPSRGAAVVAPGPAVAATPAPSTSADARKGSDHAK